MFQQTGGITSLLKEGSKIFSGLEEAILRNIDACKQLSSITRTSLGPYGMNKMVINNIEKLFVTTDAATIMKELDVTHPAAKLIVMAAKMQEDEVGDGTNFVVTFAGELLKQSEELINMGLHPSDILTGFQKAYRKTEEILTDLVTFTLQDTTNKEEVIKVLKPVLGSKIYGCEDILTPIVAEACITTVEDGQKFDIENLRVTKLTGGGVHQSYFLRGLVIERKVESNNRRAENCKVACYNCPLDPQYSDTKGTITINNADDLIKYNTGEESIAKALVDDIVQAGCQVVIVGASISEMCMHFLELANLVVVRVMSKFELRRVCRLLGATPLVRLGAPTPEETGRADLVEGLEISGHFVTLIKRETENSKLATVVLRGNTKNFLDDAERAVDDAFNTFRVLRGEQRFLTGAGAVEAQLAYRVKEFALREPGLDQYAYQRYAQAFEIFPKTLAENAGLDPNEMLSKLYSDNQATSGIDIEEGVVRDMSGEVLDNLSTKQWGIKLATDVALTVLRVDQIIMSKPSGGPNPNKRPQQEEDQ